MKLHCHNVLLLMGPSSSVSAAQQSLIKYKDSEAVLDFGLIVSPPKTWQTAKRQHAWVQSLKRWRIQNWSTESNGKLCYLHSKETSLLLMFDTTWSPPLKVYQALMQHWPELVCVYHYHNPQACLWGLAYQDGNQLYQHEALFD